MCTNLLLSANFLRPLEDTLDGKLDGKTSVDLKIIVFIEPGTAEKSL